MKWLVGILLVIIVVLGALVLGFYEAFGGILDSILNGWGTS